MLTTGPLNVEPLEPRRLLAGVITVVTTGSNIVIRGDSAANHLSVDEFDLGDGTPSGGVIFRSGGDRLIVDGVAYDRHAAFIHSAGDVFAAKPWHVDMGDGDDGLGIIRYEDRIRSMVVKLGAGDDRFAVNSHFYPENIGAAAIDGGTGDDRIFLGNMGGNVSIFPGPGHDRVAANADPIARQDPGKRLRFLGKFLVHDTQGRTSVEMSYADVRHEVLISTGNSIDHVRFASVSFGRHVTLTTRRGADVLINQSSAFRQSFALPADGPLDVLSGF
jgi:hypothetical protein